MAEQQRRRKKKSSFTSAVAKVAELVKEGNAYEALQVFQTVVSRQSPQNFGKQVDAALELAQQVAEAGTAPLVGLQFLGVGAHAALGENNVSSVAPTAARVEKVVKVFDTLAGHVKVWVSEEINDVVDTLDKWVATTPKKELLPAGGLELNPTELGGGVCVIHAAVARGMASAVPESGVDLTDKSSQIVRAASGALRHFTCGGIDASSDFCEYLAKENSGSDVSLANGVLAVLANGNIGLANALLSSWAGSRGHYYTFVLLATQVCQRRDARKLMEQLTSKYGGHISREGLDGAVRRVVRRFFPSPNQGKGGNPMMDMMASLLGGGGAGGARR